MTVTQIYQDQIKRLPISERLRLASLILNDIPKEAAADVSDEWTEDDLKDFAGAGWSRAPSETGDPEGD